MDPISGDQDAVQRFYDQKSDYEWHRLERHRTEFDVTLRALLDYLPPPPARVLDCGGGPGRYAIELARRGYQVTLFDLSPSNIHFAKEQAYRHEVQLDGYEQGSATDLARFSNHTFEAVLLLGPLYHLLGEADRRKAVSESYRVLADGGRLFAAFISCYAAHRDMACHNPLELIADTKISESILTTGCLYPRSGDGNEFVAYFAHPTEVAPLFWSLGFEVETILGLEGLVSLNEEAVNQLEGRPWHTWVDLNYRVAADPCLHGGVEHLLAVSTKPRWRSVLRRVVRILNGEGLQYKIVGGASIVLNGVLQPVKDLDIETNQDGAYRFQELFYAHMLTPVSLSESEMYRSHFGRFEIEGVPVEVMGDLQRRAGQGWVPTWANTENSVDLEGVEVRVSSLEEETLAYIRRGRLERAARCLALCNHVRLMEIIQAYF